MSGEGSFGTQIRTSTSFYQHPLGGATPNSINPALYGAYPELEYDSYVTIGLTSQPDLGAGEGEVTAVETPEHPWYTNFPSEGRNHQQQLRWRLLHPEWQHQRNR